MTAREQTSISELLREQHIKKFSGPVITVSRQYGCPGTTLANRISEVLSEKLTLKKGFGGWRVLDKDIIQEAARELNISSELAEKIAGEASPGLLGEVFRKLSDTYVPGDIQVKRTTAGIMHRLAYLGEFIIVGRAGSVLTRFADHGLHIRLLAPLEWRVERVMERENLTEEHARRVIHHSETERVFLRNYYSGEIPDETSFDLHFNCSTMTVDEMAGIVVKILEQREIISP